MSTCLLGANKCFLEDNWLSLSGAVNTVLDLSQLKLRVAFATATLAKSIYPALLSTTPKISHSLWKTAALEFTLGRAYDVWNYGSLFDYDFTHFKQETLGGLINLGSMGFESYSNWINAVPKSSSSQAVEQAATQVLEGSTDDVVSLLVSALHKLGGDIVSTLTTDSKGKVSSPSPHQMRGFVRKLKEKLDAVLAKNFFSKGDTFPEDLKNAIGAAFEQADKSNFNEFSASLRECLTTSFKELFKSNNALASSLTSSIGIAYTKTREVFSSYLNEKAMLSRVFARGDGKFAKIFASVNSDSKEAFSQVGVSFVPISKKIAANFKADQTVSALSKELEKYHKDIRKLAEETVKKTDVVLGRVLAAKRLEEQGGAVAAVDSKVEAELSKFRFWDKLPRVSTIAGHVFRGVFYAISVTNAFDNYFARVYERNEAVALRKVMADSPK